MSEKMLSPFQIRNLGSSSLPSREQDNLVRISAPGYDRTISDNPAATLKYRDEENDTIILGSSRELMDKLKEPIRQSRKSKDRMSIAMLLSEAQQNPDSLKHHIFDIDEREEIKKLWQEIQQRNKTPPPMLVNARRQPSWKSAEDALLVRLRKEDKNWEEISGMMDDRSAIHCEEHYQEHLEEVKRNKLAAAYVRLRKDIWTPIAAELEIPWEEAETIHWELGKDELGLSADNLLAKTDPSDDSLSPKSTDADWHEKRQTISATTSDALVIRSFEDYRAHHFATTMPPQLQSYRPTVYTSQASPTRLKNLSMRSSDMTSKVNLTVEGKRLAQAAGDILRARTNPSRHRKAAMSVHDHKSLQNRWADYNSSDTPFSPKPARDTAQGSEKPTLTSEGKRQAQAAGDKLRCRTNPIRHSRPSRSGSLEHCINKNRWSSYVAPRAARFDDRRHTDAELNVESQPGGTNATKADKQPTLLEVFEAELAKDPSNVIDTTQNLEFPDPEISAIPQESIKATSSNLGRDPGALPYTSFPKQPNDLFAGIKKISDHLQGLATGNAESPQELSQLVENGVRHAVGGLDTLMRGLTGGVQEFSDRTQQAADRTLEVDVRGIDDTVKGLQDFILSVTAGLDTRVSDEKKDSEKVSHETDSQMPNSRSMDNGINENSSAGSSTGAPAHAEQEVVDAGRFAEAAESKCATDAVIHKVEKKPQVVKEMKEKKEKKVLYFRHKLQRGFLSRDTTPKEDEIKMLSGVLDALEGYPDLESSIIRATKIHKVLKAMIKLQSIPFDEDFQFKTRSVELLAKWNEILSNDNPASPSGDQDDDANAKSEETASDTLSKSGPPRRKLQHDDSKNKNGEMAAPRYHQPGPIHLPKHATMSNLASEAAVTDSYAGPGYVDYLRRTSATECIGESIITRIPSPPPATTRFPTLAQFESDQHSAQSPSFPALPSMEPLVPQQAADLSKGVISNVQSLPYPDLAGPSQQKPEWNDVESATRANYILMNNGINPRNLSDSQFASFRYQAPAVQQKSIQVYASNLARNNRDFDSAPKESNTQEDPLRNFSKPSPQDFDFKSYCMAQYEAEVDGTQEQKKEWALTEYEKQITGLEQLEKQCLSSARRELETASSNPTLPGTFSSEEAHIVLSNSATHAEASERSAHQAGKDSPREAYSGSAARLVKPFDPLEAEPSAQPHLTEGIRRNATVAGTNSRHNTRRRRPYSEAYDGNGRLGWNSFLDGPFGENSKPVDSFWTNGYEQRRKIWDDAKQREKQEQLKRSATAHDNTRWSTSPFKSSDEEYDGDRMKSRVNTCVNQLRDLGYGNENDGFRDRLLVYAQAAKGDLGDAIELIEEEQRAYAEMF